MCKEINKNIKIDENSSLADIHKQITIWSQEYDCAIDLKFCDDSAYSIVRYMDSDERNVITKDYKNITLLFEKLDEIFAENK